MNLLPTELTWIIRDMAFDTPSNNYKKFLKELKRVYCHPRCSETCLFVAEFHNGAIIRRPFLIIRQYNKLCVLCDDNKISLSDHSVCHECATVQTPIEFTYHHGRC